VNGSEPPPSWPTTLPGVATIDGRTRRSGRPKRRELILQAAVGLFHERGYDGTGIDDIGEAANITGPAVYRHFRSKQEILETILRDRGTSALDEVQAIAENVSGPADALEALIQHHARTMVENQSVTVVALYERRTLSPETRSLIDRLERLNIEEWVHVLAELRPELSDTEARIIVQAVLSMGVAICNYQSGLSDERLIGLVTAMMRAGFSGS
jgi:AcrR family transcriptional regulator